MSAPTSNNLPPAAKLATEEKTIKIAEACGWKWTEEINERWWNAYWKRGPEKLIPRGDDLTARRRNRIDVLPSFTTSLDAMAEAEKTLTEEQAKQYDGILAGPKSLMWKLIRNARSATATQRAEAFGKVLDLW